MSMTFDPLLTSYTRALKDLCIKCVRTKSTSMLSFAKSYSDEGLSMEPIRIKTSYGLIDNMDYAF